MPILVRNALKINNLPELACFESFEELLKALPDFYSVEIPDTITNVIISTTEPDVSTDSQSLWIKYDTSGSFVGLFLFTGGAWNMVFPAPNEVFWLYGDSTNVPPGYINTDDAPGLTTDLKNYLKSLWHQDPTTLIFDYYTAIRGPF